MGSLGGTLETPANWVYFLQSGKGFFKVQCKLVHSDILLGSKVSPMKGISLGVVGILLERVTPHFMWVLLILSMSKLCILHGCRSQSGSLSGMVYLAHKPFTYRSHLNFEGIIQMWGCLHRLGSLVGALAFRQHTHSLAM